jgi:uncharacterized surface protein with fasciclin (FAS1) repeats
MKKILYISFAIVILGGLGVGGWLIRSGNADKPAAPVSQQPEPETTSAKSVSDLLVSMTDIKEFSDLAAPLLPATTAAQKVIVFAPTAAAIQKFTVDTALSLSKFANYHVVVTDTEIAAADGVKLKTKDGQEVLIVKKENQLYVRDAKGNDYRLRKPVQASNGKVYTIDGVLLTQ